MADFGSRKIIKIVFYTRINSKNFKETLAMNLSKSDDGSEWTDEVLLTKSDHNFLETLNLKLLLSTNAIIKVEEKSLDEELNSLGTRYNKLNKLKGQNSK